MFTKDILLSQLQASEINPKGVLLIHSSMKAVGECENGGDTVIDAFIEYMKDGLLIFPTHTWDRINAENNIFDPKYEPSNVGILTNLFMKRENVYRSLHPTHSIAAIGKNAQEYIKGEEYTRTPCSRNGCWGRLYDVNAQILFLGCSLTRNTFLHSVEEWSNIPSRLAETPQMLYVKAGDELIACPQNRHYNPDMDISQNYGKMRKPFFEMGFASAFTFGNAESVVCDARGMGNLVTHCLRKNPDLFGNNHEVDVQLYKDFKR